MTKAEIDKVIAQAKSWLGINEHENRFVEIVNVYNEIPGARGPALVSYPWCAIFVSAVFWKAIKESRFAEMACDAMINKFQNLGLYSVSGKPSVGDVIFYDWDKNGTSDHVGIITEVADNGYTVIEGNKSDAVGYRTISASYPYIKGFGLATRLDGKAVDSATESTNGQASNPSNFNGSHASEPIDNGTQSSTVGQQMAQHVIANRKRPTIQFGDTGDAVMLAQAILVDLGYLNKGGKDYKNVDGDFGLLTKSAVLGFQSHEKLTIDGIVGKNTWAKLLEAIKG